VRADDDDRALAAPLLDDAAGPQHRGAVCQTGPAELQNAIENSCDTSYILRAALQPQ
jgi:hypothetical protein